MQGINLRREEGSLDKKNFLTLGMVFLAFFAGWGFAVSTRTGNFHKDPQVRANVYVVFETVSGQHIGQSGNLITDIGERYARNTVGFSNVTGNNATDWIAVGNSTIVVTNTKLDTEATTDNATRGLAQEATWMNGTDYAYNKTFKFMFNGDITLNSTSLQWSGVSNSDNNCFAMAALPGGEQAFASGDNATITWVITWDGN